MHLFTPVWHHF